MSNGVYIYEKIVFFIVLLYIYTHTTHIQFTVFIL